MRDDIRRWWRSKWLAPGKLGRSALVDTVKSVYIPYWTFDAKVALPVGRRGGPLLLRAGAGPRSAGPSGHPAGAARPLGIRLRRRRSRLRRRADSGDARYPASISCDEIEPFPTAELVPYDTAFLSGHVVEHYQVVLNEAAGSSEAR